MGSQDSRYLHIAGAFAAGGTFTRVESDQKVEVHVPTLAAVHLPMVGGISEASARRITVDCKQVKFPRLARALAAKLRQTKLMTMGSAHSLAQTVSAKKAGTFGSNTSCECKAVQVDGLTVKQVVLNMESTHDPARSPFPKITFGNTAIVGLKLGRNQLSVELDTATFNRYPTLADFEAAFGGKGKIPAAIKRTFTCGPDGGLYKNASNYVKGSLVKNIAGTLPDGASIEDGHIIHWPGFGRIILGEILMGPYVRRVTLVRLEHSDVEVGSGCSGGSAWP